MKIKIEITDEQDIDNVFLTVQHKDGQVENVKTFAGVLAKRLVSMFNIFILSL